MVGRYERPPRDPFERIFRAPSPVPEGHGGAGADPPLGFTRSRGPSFGCGCGAEPVGPEGWTVQTFSAAKAFQRGVGLLRAGGSGRAAGADWQRSLTGAAPETVSLEHSTWNTAPETEFPTQLFRGRVAVQGVEWSGFRCIGWRGVGLCQMDSDVLAPDALAATGWPPGLLETGPRGSGPWIEAGAACAAKVVFAENIP